MTGMGGHTGPGDSSIIAEFHHALASEAALIVALLAVLFVAWNQLRSMQYRRAVTRGEQFPVPVVARPSEPSGRRFLRISFGLLWLFDGLLQLQPGMPMGLPSDVIRPAASTSPEWVRHLVDSGITVWANHPATAATAAVWIQLGIATLLLVAPRGMWSRSAGLVSSGWGLVVWSLGGAFGGIFAPGVTLLIGAPGAVLFYVVAGGLLALPESAWSGTRVGRAVLGGMGVLLLGFAIAQAWPGRGYWQGSTGGRPGTLAAMVSQMSQTPQPHISSVLVSWFAAFDRNHGWGVNLLAVVVMAGMGVVFLLCSRSTAGSGSRLLRPAMVVLVVFCLADWVLVEDFGFWGGVGTDPNSMLPLLFVAIGGYLAVTRPAAVTEEVAADIGAASPPRALDADADADADAESDTIAPVLVSAGVSSTTAAEEVTGQVPDSRPKRSWWEGIDSRHAGRVAAAIGAAGIILLGVAPMAAATVSGSADPLIAEAVNGPPEVTSSPAPPFRLIDQTGATVSLADLRGYTVVLAFIDPVCTTDCPIIAQELRVADQMLGADAARVRFVAIVANPLYRSPANVAAFDHQEGLDAMANWRFLTGTDAELRAAWYAYGVAVELTPAGGMAAHPDIVYVIDSHGVLRRIVNADPGSGDSATRSSLSGVLASEVRAVLSR